MDCLPPELVSSVLSRLPARSLLKCKCVCKSWLNLINDPQFITNHYVAYNNFMYSQDEHLLIAHAASPINPTDHKTYLSVVSWNVNDPTKHVSSTILNEFNFGINYCTEIMGPCNGIYSLQGNQRTMINPSLRQLIVLPESPSVVLPRTRIDGFGFDPKTNDYKVVVVNYFFSLHLKCGYWTTELYSLNSNSWRKLDAAFPIKIEVWLSQVYTYVNNCCHWYFEMEDAVVAFDMVNESFRKIKVPKMPRSSTQHFENKLVLVKESATICVTVATDIGIDVWVMKDYSDQESWTKQYSVRHTDTQVMYHDQFIVMGFYDNNKFLWEDIYNKKLVLYDPDSKVKTRDLHVSGKLYSVSVARYMESLVSLQRGKEIGQQISFM